MAAIHQAAQTADASGFFGRKKRRRAVLAQFADLLVVPAESFGRTPLSQLTGDMAHAFARVVGARSAMAQIPVPLVPHGWNPAVPDQAKSARDQLAWLLWISDALAPNGTPQRDDLRRYHRRACSKSSGCVSAR